MVRDESFGLRDIDRALLPGVQESLALRKIRPPDWRDETPESRQKFFDAVRGILIASVSQAELNEIATRLCDALTGVGILQPFLRQQLSSRFTGPRRPFTRTPLCASPGSHTAPDSIPPSDVRHLPAWLQSVRAAP